MSEPKTTTGHPDPAGRSRSANPTDPSAAFHQIQGQTARQWLGETLWGIFGQKLFHLTFHDWYGIRRRMLRLFGAHIHPTARIRPSVTISHPWQLHVGAHSVIGDHAILFCLGPIHIGDRCTISQYSHVCSGSHDYTKRNMPLIMDPIEIQNDVWIAADVFVGPGVTIGEDTVVGARSTVMHDLPSGSVCVGDAAKAIGKRSVSVG